MMWFSMSVNIFLRINFRTCVCSNKMCNLQYDTKDIMIHVVYSTAATYKLIFSRVGENIVHHISS